MRLQACNCPFVDSIIRPGPIRSSSATVPVLVATNASTSRWRCQSDQPSSPRSRASAPAPSHPRSSHAGRHRADSILRPSCSSFLGLKHLASRRYCGGLGLAAPTTTESAYSPEMRDQRVSARGPSPDPGQHSSPPSSYDGLAVQACHLPQSQRSNTAAGCTLSYSLRRVHQVRRQPDPGTS